MIIRYINYKNRDIKALQTFHRVEGPGKTILTLLNLFPFYSKNFKKLKFNSNFEIHLYLTLEYKKLLLDYKKLIKKIKIKVLSKVKGTRFRIINKHFKMLLFLVNFLDNSFLAFFNNFFYFNINKSIALNKEYFFKFINENNYINNIKDSIFNITTFANNNSTTSILQKKRGRKKKIVNNTKALNMFFNAFKKKYKKKGVSKEIPICYDFYILFNNGLLEFIGKFNDSVLLKFKKKIFLYYYNTFGLDSSLTKLSTKLKFFKEGKKFFFSRNMEVFNKLMKFINFFVYFHSNKSIGNKNTLLDKPLISFFKKKRKIKYYFFHNFYKNNLLNSNIVINPIVFIYYYYDSFYYFNYPYNITIHFKSSISFLNAIVCFENKNTNTPFTFYDIKRYAGFSDLSFHSVRFNKYYKYKSYLITRNLGSKDFSFFYPFYYYSEISNKFASFYNIKNTNFYAHSIKNIFKNFIVNKKEMYKYAFNSLFNEYFFQYNIRSIRIHRYEHRLDFETCFTFFSFYANLSHIIMLKNRLDFKLKSFKTAEWHNKFDSMVMFERFRLSNRLYIHDKLSKLRSNLTIFYRSYFYNYLYELMATWNLLDHLPKKRKTEITRWLKKVQRFLSHTHHHLLKDLIKNFVWKDHKVLNKLVKSHSIWKGKKFITARQASGSYYYAVNLFFIENLNILKLRLATNDLVYENFSLLDELLLNYRFIFKNDKIRDKKKKKISERAKKYYELLNKQKESKGIFYCKFARMSYNLNNDKSVKKYLSKLLKLVIPIKTYYRLYDTYLLNLNNYNKNKSNNSTILNNNIKNDISNNNDFNINFNNNLNNNNSIIDNNNNNVSVISDSHESGSDSEINNIVVNDDDSYVTDNNIIISDDDESINISDCDDDTNIITNYNNDYTTSSDDDIDE